MMKKALFVIASRDFRDEEYFVPREILIGSGFKVRVAGDTKGPAIGADGGEVKIELSLDEVSVNDFDAIIFVGGPGCLRLLDNDESYRIAREAASKGIMLAAICIAPVILAKAGVLDGKDATVWTGPMDRSAIGILESRGAKYKPEGVVVDGNIVTADGPTSAVAFAGAVDREVKKR